MNINIVINLSSDRIRVVFIREDKTSINADILAETLLFI